MKVDTAERKANSLKQLQRVLKAGSRVYVHTVDTLGDLINVEVYAPVLYTSPFVSESDGDLRIEWLTAHVANVTGRRRTEGGTGPMCVVDDGGTEARTKIAADLTRILGFEVTAERI